MTRAFLATRRDRTVDTEVVELDDADLGEGDVDIDIDYSSVNFKDALAVDPNGNVARLEQLVPGVDLAGTVTKSTSEHFAPGDRVLAHGYGVGVSHHGGFAAAARLPAEWLVPLPHSLSTREAMILGTAGFTAALSVLALEEHGLTPGEGPVLVTGATGGVGSVAVSLLAGRGYEVVASTGKESSHRWLHELGAARIIGRGELAASTKPLEEQRWHGAVDCVGGPTLAAVIRQLHYGAAVAASGLTGGPGLELTVFPFILRSVALLGIDSVQLGMARRRQVWDAIAGGLRPEDLESLVAGEVDLNGLPEVLATIARGGVQGRHLVVCN